MIVFLITITVLSFLFNVRMPLNIISRWKVLTLIYILPQGIHSVAPHSYYNARTVKGSDRVPAIICSVPSILKDAVLKEVSAGGGVGLKQSLL